MDRRTARRTDRRTLLRRGAATGSLLLAGCMGSTADQGTSLTKTKVDFYANDEGFLELSIIVTNTGNERESGLLLIHATLNGESHERVREIALDAHATQEYLVTFDVKMEDVTEFSPGVTIQGK